MFRLKHRPGFLFLLLLFFFLCLFSSPLLSLPEAKGAPGKPLLLKFCEFDPLEGELPLPQALKARGPFSSSLYYLIQFKGHLKEEWKKMIWERGGEFLGFIPKDGRIVRIPADGVALIKELPFVRWMGPYHPAYKISPMVGIRHFTGSGKPEESVHQQVHSIRS